MASDDVTGTGQVPGQPKSPRRSWREIWQGCTSSAGVWLRDNGESLGAAASLVQVVGLPLLLVGIFVTVRQLELTTDQVRYAASQTQGQIIQAVGKDGRDLFFKVWEDEALRPILDPDASGKLDRRKADAFVGVVIGHYALVFRQEKLGNIPREYWDEVVLDAKKFFKSPDVAERWKVVKAFYRADFRSFVDSL